MKSYVDTMWKSKKTILSNHGNHLYRIKAIQYRVSIALIQNYLIHYETDTLTLTQTGLVFVLGTI